MPERRPMTILDVEEYLRSKAEYLRPNDIELSDTYTAMADCVNDLAYYHDLNEQALSKLEKQVETLQALGREMDQVIHLT